MQDLNVTLFNLNNDLTASIKLLRKHGEALAVAERDYKVKLRQEVLKLRESGMAVTLIDLTIYGVPEVAELRLKRDIAKTIYEANQDHINAVKLQMRLLEEQIKREWSNEIPD